MSEQSKPLAGPLEQAPSPSLGEAREQLRAAVKALPLGAYDQVIIDWLARWDAPTIATVASIIHRARTEPRA